MKPNNDSSENADAFANCEELPAATEAVPKAVLRMRGRIVSVTRPVYGEAQAQVSHGQRQAEAP